VEIFDESGEKIGRNQVSTFVQRAGGFGGKRASDRAIQPINPPSRTPDASMSEKTSVDQVGGRGIRGG
jgi:3-hydroxyacyl-CoA dehydrogenase/3a,7a,12a-trihydroxy-5b-cholest-24-enoyl-CoA hydratase